MSKNKEVAKDSKIVIDDNYGLIKMDGKLYKKRKKEGNTFIFEEINVKEYDKLILETAQKIMDMPDVDLSLTLKDALYDLTLEQLNKIKRRLDDELCKQDPKVRTIVRERGTCVSLAIGGIHALELRH